MHLAEFILREMEPILKEWEAFAATLLPAAAELNPAGLRDHARQILEAIARDLETPQTRQAQSEKSRGRAPTIEGAAQTAAQTHALSRVRGGFEINQLIAEYRALRASVLRLWMDFAPLDPSGARDMMRFNEAIDQAVAESVFQFHQSIQGYRHLLLGMLGHDMRSPLQSILLTAQSLARQNAGETISQAAESIQRGGAAMQALLDDLMDFNRVNLGLGIRIERAEVDLAQAAGDELAQFRAAHPDRHFEFTVTGDARGRWDGPRLRQMLRNLLANAITHGAPNEPVHLSIQGAPPKGAGAGGARLEVSNAGALDPVEARQFFEPLRRGEAAPARDGAGMGLGLFIVREIVKAHGGEVETSSQEAGGGRTSFIVHLPRDVSVPPAAA